MFSDNDSSNSQDDVPMGESHTGDDAYIDELMSEEEGEEDNGGEIITLMAMLRQQRTYHLQADAELDHNITEELYERRNHAQEGTSYSSGRQETASASQDGVAEQRTTTLLGRQRRLLENYKKKKANRKRKPVKEPRYRTYSNIQISDFMDLVIEQNPIKVAAAVAGISLKSAYYYRSLWNKHEGTIPQKKKGPKKSDDLKEDHTQFILELVDSFAAITLDEMRLQLLDKFPELKISKSSFYRFIKDECCLSMKKLEKLTEYRLDPANIEKRRVAVQSWIDDTELDYEKNCLFIDEAGFNLHISRTRGWAIKGAASQTEMPKVKGTNISILGAICNEGVVSLSLRKPSTISASKNRKVDGTVVTVKSRVGTTRDHFIDYLGKLLAIMEQNELRNYYIFLDNASIHKSQEITDLIENRGHKLRYIPAHSPFLNPIEEFWSKLKYGVKRRPFKTGDSLTPRIMESCMEVTPEDCMAWIRHSASFFDDCIDSVAL